MCLPSVYLNMLSNIIQRATTFLNPVYRVVETININTYNVPLHHTPYAIPSNHSRHIPFTITQFY